MESAEEQRYGVSAAIVNWGPESGQATCAAGRQIPKTRTRPTSVRMKGWISNMSDMNCRLHLIGLRWLTCTAASQDQRRRCEFNTAPRGKRERSDGTLQQGESGLWGRHKPAVRYSLSGVLKPKGIKRWKSFTLKSSTIIVDNLKFG